LYCKFGLHVELLLRSSWFLLFFSFESSNKKGEIILVDPAFKNFPSPHLGICSHRKNYGSKKRRRGNLHLLKNYEESNQERVSFFYIFLSKLNVLSFQEFGPSRKSSKYLSLLFTWRFCDLLSVSLSLSLSPSLSSEKISFFFSKFKTQNTISSVLIYLNPYLTRVPMSLLLFFKSWIFFQTFYSGFRYSPVFPYNSPFEIWSQPIRMNNFILILYLLNFLM